MENDRVCGFTFIGKGGFIGHSEFPSVCNTFGVQVVTALPFWMILSLNTLFSLFLIFLPVCCHARFIKLITHLIKIFQRLFDMKGFLLYLIFLQIWGAYIPTVD